MTDLIPTRQLEELRNFALQLAELAAQETVPRFRNGIGVDNKLKEDFDPVTEADKQAEKVIRQSIEQHYPEHDILGEEFGASDNGSSWRWVLDPVDGTRAFICGVPSWTTLIALEYEFQPVLGVIAQPYMNECWVGAATADGTQLRRQGISQSALVSGLTELSAARVTTTDPRGTAYFTPDEAAAFEKVATASRVQRFGLDAYGYALLASGEFDLVIEAGLQRYDAAALVPVVENAGGIVTDWSGNPIGENWENAAAEDGKRGQIIAAASRELLDQALPLLAGAAL
jgi:myo-inositol-1(or 4)-monophosphatase